MMVIDDFLYDEGVEVSDAESGQEEDEENKLNYL